MPAAAPEACFSRPFTGKERPETKRGTGLRGTAAAKKRAEPYGSALSGIEKPVTGYFFSIAFT